MSSSSPSSSAAADAVNNADNSSSSTRGNADINRSRTIQEYNLKTDMAMVGKQGRLYANKYASKPGGIKVDDMLFGCQMSHLALLDDHYNDTSKSPELFQPNAIETLNHILNADDEKEETKAGGEGNGGKVVQDAVGIGEEGGNIDSSAKEQPNPAEGTNGGKGSKGYEPLSKILKEKFNLKLDCTFHAAGTRYEQSIDLNGFIASNETTMILSFRDVPTHFQNNWMSNLNAWSSEWEPQDDEAKGQPGDLCACAVLDGWFNKEDGKLRVHTGYYNNFVYSIPKIRQYILEPLQIGQVTTPKRVYVCGAGVGGAVATLAYAFILQALEKQLEHPDSTNHQLVSVTIGSPRVMHYALQRKITHIVNKLKVLDRATICRLVYNNDIVPHLPLHFHGFVHLGKLIYITVDGQSVMINPNLDKQFKNVSEFATILRNFMSGTARNSRRKGDEEEILMTARGKFSDEEKTEFETEILTTSTPYRNHMTYWYLLALERLQEQIQIAETIASSAGAGTTTNGTTSQEATSNGNGTTTEGKATESSADSSSEQQAPPGLQQQAGSSEEVQDSIAQNDDVGTKEEEEEE